MRGRGGAAAVEGVFVLALAIFVLAAVGSAVLGSLRWLEQLGHRVESQEVIRTIWVILDEEVRPGLPGRDWELEDERALVLRAFRGVGRVCRPEERSSQGWAVAWRGLRRPDPDRDSLLVLGADGGWRAEPLLGARSGSGWCELGEGEREEHLDWPGSGRVAPILVRGFERGRLSLEDGALRYRRGSGGRQPLTVERLASESRFLLDGDGLRVHLILEGSGLGRVPTEWAVTGARVQW